MKTPLILIVFLSIYSSNTISAELPGVWESEAAARAKLLSEVKWTPVAETMPNRKGGFFQKGTEYTGVPYSSVRSIGRYIGYDISLRTFLAAVENPRSVLYTETLVGKLSNAAAFYGAVCSSYTSYALLCGVPEVSRHHGPDFREGVIPVAPQSGRAARVGDIIFTPPARKNGGSHIEIVTAVTHSSRGEVFSILVEESKPPTTISTERTVAEFDAHLAAKKRELYRITDLDQWRGSNRAEPLHFPNYENDAAPPTINRSLLLDLGDWVVYEKGQPVKFNVMDRDERGTKALVIRCDENVVEEITMTQPGVVERIFTECGDYTAAVTHADGSQSESCHFAVCDLNYEVPESISISKEWSVSFKPENMEIIAINLQSISDSYGRHPLFLTNADRRAGSITVPANLLKKTGRLHVWLIGEHPLGRLKQLKTITMVE
ncbi:MAG: hypothetical protein P1U58_03830 [Verrucomicrobiales bacterium]|nr:hypothetical protein [Verrucomicrobiales bacterium]